MMLICSAIRNVSNLKFIKDSFFFKEREINLRDYEDQAGKKPVLLVEWKLDICIHLSSSCFVKQHHKKHKVGKPQ